MRAAAPEHLLEAPGLLRRVSASVALRVIGQLVAVAATGLGILMLTRHLSVRDYGYYITATTIGAFAVVLVDSGISGIAIRDAAKDPERRDALAAAAIRARLVMAFVGAAVALAFAAVAYSGHERSAVFTGCAVFALSLPFTAVSGGFEVLGESAVRIGPVIASRSAGRVVYVAALALVIVGGGGYLWVFLPLSIGAVVTTASLAVLYRRHVGRSAAGPGVLSMMRAALPLGLALVLNVLFFRLDAILLSVLRPPRDVAIYGLAYRALELVLSLGTFLLASMLPVMSAATRDRDRWRFLADKVFAFLLAVGLSVAACGWLVAPRVAILLGGVRYAAAGSVLGILLLAAGLSGVNGFGGIMLISLDKQGRALWLNASALAFNFVANLALIPTYGYTAAAWVTVASEVVNFCGMVVLVRRYGDYRWLPRAAPQILLLTATVTGVCALARWLGMPLAVLLALPTAVWLVGAVRLRLLPVSVLRGAVEAS